MHTKWLHIAIAFVILIVVNLACNLPLNTSAPVQEEPAATQSEEATLVEETEATTDEAEIPIETVPVGSIADCPQADGDTFSYIDEGAGYCLLIPNHFEWSEQTYNDRFAAWFIGPAVDPDAAELLQPMLSVDVIAVPGAAANITATEWAAEAQADWENEPLVLEEANFGNHPGVFRPRHPQIQIVNRTGYVIVSDTLYTIQIGPLDFDQIADDIDLAWSLALETLHFFPPEYDGGIVLPEDVCPNAPAGGTLIVKLFEGYCLTLPEGYVEDPDFPSGKFVRVDDLDLPFSVDVETIPLSVTVGFVGDTGETAQQAGEHFGEFAIDPVLEKTTIAGYEAVILHDEAGEPIPDRLAIVVARENQYTILGQPFTPLRRVDDMPDLELLWEHVLGSIQFFDAWR